MYFRFLLLRSPPSSLVRWNRHSAITSGLAKLAVSLVMALQDILALYMPSASISWTLLPFALVWRIVIRCIYRIFLHPLRHIPGPLHTKCSSLWLVYHQYIGDTCTAIHRLHDVYGPVVRIAPNDIDMAKNDALGPIYVDQGGFNKSEYYLKFHIYGHLTIFSTLALAERSSRAKAVLPVFSTQSIREATETISGIANKMVRRMSVEAKTGRPVDILKLTRAFAMDTVSTYILHQRYGGLDESLALQSVYPYLDFATQLSGYFWVSHSLYVWIEWLLMLINLDSKTKSSIRTVELFIETLVNKAKVGGNSFPSRLLAKGVPVDQVTKECVDVVYAGTETTGHVLATIFWNLVASPER